MKYVEPASGGRYRVLVLISATRGWYEAPAAERENVALPRFAAWLARWEALGARLLSSFDDDLFKAGEPAGGATAIYLCYEVPSLDIVPTLLHEVREEVDGARLDRWLRFEARPGRGLFLAADFT
jgi:hypothetical protein